MVLSRSEPQRLNPERQAQVHPDQDDAVDSEVIAVEDDDPIENASQAHILKVMELMGCDEGYESAVRQLPQIDVRHEVQCASVPSEVDVAAMNRVENVFRRGLKAWALMLLLNLRIKGDLKMAFSIQSITTTIEELEDCENQVASCVPSSSISLEVLNSIPNTIRDMLWHEKCYTSIPARKLLVPSADIPHAYIASLLNISNKYAGCLAFQAKVDRLYITHRVSLQEYSQTQSHVPRDSVHFAVDFIYSDDNVGRLAWQAKKRTPNRDPRWKGLDHVFALRRGNAQKATHWTVYILLLGETHNWGGKQQEPRAGVDYIKVNFHTDNFSIIDRIIDVITPLSDIHHTLCNELRQLRSSVFTFLSYGYAAHARKGVKASSEEIAQHTHQVQDHEAKQLTLYTKVEELASQPNLFDEPNTQEEFVDLVRRQLHCCVQTKGSEVMENDCATTHSSIFSLDLVSACNRSPKPGGHLCCSACRSPFQFYDKLRCIAMAKLNDDPNRLSEIADVLLTIHQCERRSYRYMAHVMLAAQKAHHMKLAIVQMDSSTAYMVYDFKQKFLAKGFREGGDAACQWTFD
eukprot:Em0001g275a